MGGVFISYRRDDTAPYAGRPRDRLSAAGKSITFSAPAGGRLYLGINDAGVYNNDGAFTVEIRPG